MLALFAGLAFAGASMGADETTDARPASVTAKDPADQRWTTDKSFSGAVSTPLRDANLIRSKIPPLLLDAMDAPYAVPEETSCQEIAAEVSQFDLVLGPDLDQPYSPDNPGLVQRSGSTAYMAVKGASEMFIPGIGFIRYLSGAERHDAVVRAAIEAGAVRRAFLKGLGLSRGCRPPSAPLAEALAAEPGASRAQAHRARARTPWSR